MLTRTIKPQKKYAGCQICHHRQRETIEGEILEGTPCILLSNRYDVDYRALNRHLGHMRDKLVNEVLKDKDEVLERILQKMEETNRCREEKGGL